MWLVTKVLYPSFGVKKGLAEYQLPSTVPLDLMTGSSQEVEHDARDPRPKRPRADPLHLCCAYHVIFSLYHFLSLSFPCLTFSWIELKWIGLDGKGTAGQDLRCGVMWHYDLSD
jgi:hypothetical protein